MEREHVRVERNISGWKDNMSEHVRAERQSERVSGGNLKTTCEGGWVGWGAEYQRGKIDRRTARLFGTARLFVSHTHILSHAHTHTHSLPCLRARSLSVSLDRSRARACAHMTGDYKDMDISPLAKAVSKTVAQVSKNVEETSGGKCI